MVVAERLSHRIKSGDYHVHGVPAERELASEVGVSYTTVRKAVQRLLDAGLLYRQSNGRLAVSAAEPDKRSLRQVALLAPAWESNEANLWNIALAQLRSSFRFGSRVVHYMHWDDPVIRNTIQQFDATFLLPPDAPEEFAEGLREIDKPLVILNRDWSDRGFHSLRLLPPHFIHKLLDHLAELGHRRIDCFNVQRSGAVMRQWIEQWQLWRTSHRMEGKLLDAHSPVFGDTLEAAYSTITRTIRESDLTGTAMLCLTETAAIGAVRAMLDHNIRPGRDIALCAIGSKRCEYLSPSITTLEEPDPMAYLATGLQWAFSGDDAGWTGPLLIQPPDLKVMVRQSTVMDIDNTQRPSRVRRAEEFSTF